jgi:hypothetical protein
MMPDNKNKTLFRENGTERKITMSAQSLVMLLNAFYLVMMGLVSLVGTATLVELTIVLLHEKPRQKTGLMMEPEDA